MRDQPRMAGFGIGLRSRRLVPLSAALGLLMFGLVSCGGQVREGETVSTSASNMVTIRVASTAPPATLSDTGSSTAPSIAPSTAGTGSNAEEAVDTQLIALARALAPVPVYGPVPVPSEIAASDPWWPVHEVEAPEDYRGPVTDNPRVSGDGMAREGQLVLRWHDAWVILLENFRGDLGDMIGEPAGQVEGHPVYEYQLNGGVLVQWSDRGAWFGVFARGLETGEMDGLVESIRLVRTH